MDDKDSITITLAIGDMQMLRPDLTNEQCMAVLKHAEANLDFSIGLNWNMLSAYAENLFPQSSDQRVRALQTHASAQQIDTSTITPVENADEVGESTQRAIFSLKGKHFNTECGEYLVLSDEEAETLALDKASKSLAAIDAAFLINHKFSETSDYTKEDLEKALGFMGVNNGIFESSMPLYQAMLNFNPEFFKAAVDANGRGAFIACDHHEDLIELDENVYFVYRVTFDPRP